MKNVIKIIMALLLVGVLSSSIEVRVHKKCGGVLHLTNSEKKEKCRFCNGTGYGLSFSPVINERKKCTMCKGKKYTKTFVLEYVCSKCKKHFKSIDKISELKDYNLTMPSSGFRIDILPDSILQQYKTNTDLLPDSIGAHQ